MKLASLLSFACLLTSALAQSPAPAPQPRTQAGLLATEQAWVHALESSDVAQLATILAPGFADTTWDGHVWPRATVLAATVHRPPGTTLQLSDLSAVIVGDTGLVRGLNKTHTANGASHEVRFTDCFYYEHNHWVALSAQETLVR